ncbi:LuxR C-terminal-related transcriptional regulator [Streptomyces kanasensis]|uniref:helix-turn-helix transcriptional regulator n=1 Tax=Streptomyces kanasensis TaxID=936756 RepID=UPI0036F844B5
MVEGPGEAARWPLVDRDAELAEIAARVGRGRSVLVTGQPGTGTSRLLHEALARLAPGERPTGHGDLVRLLRQCPRGPEERRAPGRSAGGTTRRVLAVDDVHALDAAASGALAALVREGRIRLLAGAPSGAPLPAALAALFREGALGPVTARPFDQAGTTRALRARLGSQVATDTAARLGELTGGNPLLLTELVEASAADGTLRPAQGLWHWRGPAPRPAARVVRAVRRLLGPLDAEERELVALLALGGPLSDDLPLVARLAAPAERLDRRAVIAAEPVGRGTRLRLCQPLCGETVLADLPAGTARELRRRLADALEEACDPGTQPAGTAALLSVTLRVDAGRPPSAGRLRAAAEVALLRHDFATAERYARLALGETVPTARAPRARDVDAASALLLGRALSGQGRGADAEAVLAAADGRTADVLAARVRNLAWGLRRPEAAAALAERVPGGTAGVLRAVTGLLRDRVDEVAAAGEAALRGTGGGGTAQSCVPVAAFARVETGGGTAALALLERCRQVEGWRDEDRHAYLAVGAYAAVEAGDDHGARLFLDRMRRTDASYDLCRRVRADVTRARAHRARGRLPEAVALLRRAAAVPGGQDWFTTRPWVLAQLAGALAEAGEVSEALVTLVEVRLSARQAPRYPLADDGVALEEAEVLGRAGDLPGAVHRAEEVARRSAAAGRRATALAALHLLARLGRAEVAVERLAGLGDALACPLGGLRAAHVRALAHRDAGLLDELARRWAARGRFPLAAESASRAHGLWRETGRNRAARASSVACGEYLSLAGGVPLPGWAACPGSAPRAGRARLTPREHEVASLAASGMTNADIARRLTVSVRTVENHLHRVYGKLGVTSRSGLHERIDAPAGGLQPVRE